MAEQSQGRDNLKYIWKRNQELMRRADEALDAFAASCKESTPIEVAEKVTFLGKLKTVRIEACPFARMESGRHIFTFNPGVKKKFGDDLHPITDIAPAAYIDAERCTYFSCSYEPDHRFVYIQVDRETAVGFLFKVLGLPIKEDPSLVPAETDRLFEEAMQKIHNYLS